MPMHLVLAIEGRFRQYMEQERRAMRDAIPFAVDETARAIQTGARREIDRVFTGRRTRNSRFTSARRVSGAIRLKSYRDGPFDAAAIVFSKFGRGRPGTPDFDDFLAPHVFGLTIRPRHFGRKWLYIPLTKGARARRSRRAAGLNDKLAFVPLPGGRALLVERTRSRSKLIALLVKQVRFRPELDFDRLVDAEERALPQRIVSRLESLNP